MVNENPASHGTPTPSLFPGMQAAQNPANTPSQTEMRRSTSLGVFSLVRTPSDVSNAQSRLTPADNLTSGAFLLSSLFGTAPVEIPATISSCDDVMLYEHDEGDACFEKTIIDWGFGASPSGDLFWTEGQSGDDCAEILLEHDENIVFEEPEPLSVDGGHLVLKEADDAMQTWPEHENKDPSPPKKRRLSDFEIDEVGLDLDAFPDNPVHIALPSQDAEMLVMSRKPRKKRKAEKVNRLSPEAKKSSKKAKRTPEPALEPETPGTVVASPVNGRTTLPSPLSRSHESWEDMMVTESPKAKRTGVAKKSGKAKKASGSPKPSAVPSRVRSALTVEFSRRRGGPPKDASSSPPGVAEVGAIVPRRSARQAAQRPSASSAGLAVAPLAALSEPHASPIAHAAITTGSQLVVEEASGPSSSETTHSPSPSEADEPRFHLTYRRDYLIQEMTKLLRSKKKNVNGINKRLEALRAAAKN